MNLKTAKLGAEPKKLALLAALVLVALYFLWSNLGSSPGDAAPARPAARRAAPAASQPQAGDAATQPVSRRRDSGGRDSLAEFRPTLKRKKEDQIDPARIDPTLKLALLVKLRQVPLQGGQRSLFDFAPEPVKEATKVVLADKQHIGMPKGPEEAKPETPSGPPPPPPIPLKFYGFVSATSDKRAFFLDGDEILVAAEGEIIKKRYKVVRIGISSAVVKDEQSNSEQTLPLVQEDREG